MALDIRPADELDAGEMASTLNEIIRIGGTTAYRQTFDMQGIIDSFISPGLGISCFVAKDGPRFLGFQALEWSDPDWQGEDLLPEGWALVATYVSPRAHKKGVGRALFTKTIVAAKAAGVCFIDATIRKENTGGQAYYKEMGFTDYKIGAENLSKRFEII